MNYLKHYIKLIRNAERRLKPAGRLEKHHTFPKSLFGDNKRLVSLTPKEHYVAHALLEKIYMKRYGLGNDKTHKMTRAFYMMNNMSGVKSSRLYESNRKRYLEAITGIPRTEEVKQKIRKPKKAGHGEAVSRSKKGMEFSEQHRRSLSEAHKKRSVYAKGYSISEDHKEKLRKVDRSYTKTPEYREYMSQKSKEAWANRKVANGI